MDPNNHRIETNSTRFTCIYGQRHFFRRKLKYVLETFSRDMLTNVYLLMGHQGLRKSMNL